MKTRIGIIGFGNMGQAIAQRVKSGYSVLVFEKDRKKTRKLSGIKLAKNALELVNKSEAIILAVKPQDFSNLLNKLKNKTSGKLIISVAAGVSTKYIEKKLPRAKVIRVMPNLGAKIAKSVTCLSKGKFATKSDLLFAKKLFSCVGKTQLFRENQMNAVTAVSGSGPAYICFAIENKLNKENFMEEFKSAAGSVGFNSSEADFLVKNTFKCTVEVLKKTKIAPGLLRQQVTSKGGTTEAALKVLNMGGSLTIAIKAALKRAKQLSKG